MKDREDLESCGCRCAAFPGPMIHGVLGHYLDSGKSPDAWSLATSGSCVWGGKSWEDLEAPWVILGESCQDQFLCVRHLYTIS